MPKGYSAHNQRTGKTVGERLAFHSRPSASGCRLWNGSKNLNGYGKLLVAGRLMLAHRAAYADANGPIPPGLCVCHKCDVPSCIEPTHLFLGSRRDNTNDMITKGRHGDHMRQRAH